MNFDATIIDHEREDLFAIELAGVAVSGDAEQVSALIEHCRARGIHNVAVDFQQLGSISQMVAQEIAGWQRWLMDHGGNLVVVQPNVAVRWLLEQALGSLPLDIVPDRESALGRWTEAEAPAEETAGMGVNIATRTLGSHVSHPDRSILETLGTAFDHLCDPADCGASITAALARAGLAERAVLLLVKDDNLVMATSDEVQVPAHGWLGSLLQGANHLMAYEEIGTEGLSMSEMALMKWTGADLYLPLINQSRFHGVLALTSGREGGLMSYRSGEILALGLIGQWIAQRFEAMPGNQVVAQADMTEPVAMSVI
jgi:anti-anti-sigma regulatory factor